MDIHQYQRIMKKDLDNTMMTTEERRLLLRLTQLEQSPKWQIIVCTALEACVPYGFHQFYDDLQSIINYLGLKDLDIAHLNKYPIKDQMKMIKIIFNKMEEKIESKYHLTEDTVKNLDNYELGEKYIKILEPWKNNHIKENITIEEYVNLRKEIYQYFDYCGALDDMSTANKQKLLLNLKRAFNWQVLIKAVYEVTLSPLPYGIDSFKENLNLIGKYFGCSKNLSRLNEYDIDLQLKNLLTLFNEMDDAAGANEEFNPEKFKGIEMFNFSKKYEMAVELWKIDRIQRIEKDIEIALSKI